MQVGALNEEDERRYGGNILRGNVVKM